jgi:hypothetical protein
MPKSNKQVIIDFIVTCLKNGEQRGNILVKAGKKWGTSKSAFDRLLKIAKEQHTKEQEALKTELAEVDKQAAIKVRKKQIMTANERKVLLTKLANGQIKISRKEWKWNSETKKFQLLSYTDLPNHAARTSAISELNKMGGDYAAKKVELTGKDGLPIETENTQVILYMPDQDKNADDNY